jgi:hypothetical protein
MGMESAMGMHPPISHGPASVAASAIIGPSPGGVAGKSHLVMSLGLPLSNTHSRC